MTVTRDILASWRSPRTLLRAKLAQGVRDDRALAVVMGACFLLFVAQWPALSRAAHFDPSVPLDARMGATLLATVFMLPLVLYAIAALSHVIARMFGGRGSFYGARLALFWSLLCAAPLTLFHGIVAGFIGPGTQLTIVGLIVLAAFLWLWLTMLHEAERG